MDVFGGWPSASPVPVLNQAVQQTALDKPPKIFFSVPAHIVATKPTPIPVLHERGPATGARIAGTGRILGPRQMIQRLVKMRAIPFVRIRGTLRFPVELLDRWARQPDLVAAKWFAGKEAGKDDVNVSTETSGKALGRALFLQGRERSKA